MAAHRVTDEDERQLGVVLPGTLDEEVEVVLAAGRAAGEQHWPMPIPEEMGEKVRSNSKIADLAQHNSEKVARLTRQLFESALHQASDIV